MMLKKFFRNNYSQSMIAWMISIYIKFCYHTSSWIIKDESNIKHLIASKKKLIICFWHSRLLMAPLCWNFSKEFYMLISSHADGRLISKAVSHFQISTITGSQRKKKISSTKEIIKKIKNNQIIGITPDGPRGPKMKSKTGISTIANSFQATILPLSYSARFKIKMKSWDEFLFVFPFNKFVIVWGNPINSNDSINDNNHAKIVENELNRITKLSDNLVK